MRYNASGNTPFAIKKFQLICSKFFFFLSFFYLSDTFENLHLRVAFFVRKCVCNHFNNSHAKRPNISLWTKQNKIYVFFLISHTNNILFQNKFHHKLQAPWNEVCQSLTKLYYVANELKKTRRRKNLKNFKTLVCWCTIGCKTEIANFDTALMKENIVAFNVTMNDWRWLRMQIRKTLFSFFSNV